MKKENLVINVLGDSITVGAKASEHEKCFVRLLQNKYGFKEVNGYGVGGSRIARQRVPSLVAAYDRCFLDRFEEMGDADIIIVFGGTNDWGHGDAHIGNKEDKDEYTFCGAVNSLIEKLDRKYKDKFVFFITPLHRKDDESLFGEGQKKEGEAPLATYVDNLLYLLRKNEIPVLDLFHDKEFAPDKNFFDTVISPDGVHPTDCGHLKIAQSIVEFLTKNKVID